MIKAWYETKDSDREVIHGGTLVSLGKKILLSEEQAALHGGAIRSAQKPKTKEECANCEEFVEATSSTPSAKRSSRARNETSRSADVSEDG